MRDTHANVSYYDILGVAPDASREEIRRSWRAAVDRFEPGSGGSSAQFRLFNEAAEVLLDPERRSAYDAERDRREQPAEPAEPVDAVDAEDTAAGRGVPLPVIAALAAGFVLLVLLATWGAAVPGLGTAAWGTVQEHEAAQRVERTVPPVAERAAVSILSYSHKSLDTDKADATRYMTEAYRKKYVATFDSLVRDNATDLKAEVAAEVVASGVAHTDAGRARILLFVNQTTTSAANDAPQVALNRVMLDMVDQDGTWLVDDITSY